MRKVLLAGAAAVSVAAAHGIEEPPDTVGTIAITGGTGAYRSARGQIHFRDTRPGTTLLQVAIERSPES